MIQKFVDRFMKNKEAIRARFDKKPENYIDIVKIVIEEITDDSYNEAPDPERIHEIDDGDYQGTLLYVIAAKGYQPSDYWSIKVNYGSCSVCDTLESINYMNWSEDGPTEAQLDQYMTLALHIVQGIKEI